MTFAHHLSQQRYHCGVVTHPGGRCHDQTPQNVLFLLSERQNMTVEDTFWFFSHRCW